MMPPRRRTPCAALLGALLVTCVACGPEPIGGVVAPRQREFFMRASKHFDVEADLGALAFSKEPIDVLLLFDRTASMSNVIREAQVRAVELVGGIASLYPNAAFAVAGLADYFGGERAWVLYQDVTTDRTAVESGLGQISEASGGDYPEAYARALQEARSIGWRPGGGKKYVILFGDAPAHDPTFYGVDFGVDAGRDGIRGTSDDLRVEPLVADRARRARDLRRFEQEALPRRDDSRLRVHGAADRRRVRSALLRDRRRQRHSAEPASRAASCAGPLRTRRICIVGQDSTVRPQCAVRECLPRRGHD
jgi:hypothetical protein